MVLHHLFSPAQVSFALLGHGTAVPRQDSLLERADVHK